MSFQLVGMCLKCKKWTSLHEYENKLLCEGCLPKDEKIKLERYKARGDVLIKMMRLLRMKNNKV